MKSIPAEFIAPPAATLLPLAGELRLTNRPSSDCRQMRTSCPHPYGTDVGTPAGHRDASVSDELRLPNLGKSTPELDEP